MNQRESGPFVWLAILGSTCLILGALQYVLWLVIPFLLGMILYYILVPAMYRLLLLGLGRTIAATAIASAFFIASVIVAVWAIPALMERLGSSQAVFNHYLDGGIAFVRHSVAMLEHQFAVLQRAQASATVDKWLTSNMNDFMQEKLGNIAVSVAGSLPSLLLAPFLTFFFLRDGAKFKRFLGKAVPNAFFEETLYLLHEVDQTARRYFQGLLKLTVIDTCLLASGLWMIGMSSALVLGLISAVLAWIPFVGSVAGCLMVVLVAAADTPGNPAIAYSAIGVFLAVRLLDDFVFMPLTLGKSLHMHPLLTVLMIFIGGEVAGVAGLMLVLPILGVAMVVGQSIGAVMTNPRLRARHRYARSLREAQVNVDLIG